MRTFKRSMRRSHTVSPFGVGAICNLGKESLVAMDTEIWGPDGRRIEHIPLQQELRVSGFREAEDERFSYRRVPMFRFPRWLFCNRCRRMVHWRTEDEQQSQLPYCPHCPGQRILVPMRFVLVCSDGHLADVPWKLYAHSRSTTPEQRGCRVEDLEYASDGRSAGLASLYVRCRVCDAKRSFAGLTSESAMSDLNVMCWGTQPWQFAATQGNCVQRPRVVQRGAGDIYFAVTRTGLDIPPHSDFDYHSETTVRVRAHELFGYVCSNPEAGIAPQMMSIIADACETDLETVRIIVASEARDRAGRPPSGASRSLEEEEYGWFLAPLNRVHPKNRFLTKHIDLASLDAPLQKEVVEHIDKVVVGTKLRLVKALCGFSRYGQTAIIPPDLGKGQDWLPAIEIFGEGIFLRLNEERLVAWESLPSVQERVAPLTQRASTSILGHHLPDTSARFVLLHTLSHLLIRQLAYDCGYTSACLSERLYVKKGDPGEGMAGVLIYTADGDSEGTLGGLARQGEPDRLVRTLLAALQTAQWCSLDPICGERPSQGYDGLNLAACHACSLVSETSCGYFNSLLDRTLLVGNGSSVPGFFDGLLAKAEEMAGDEAS